MKPVIVASGNINQHQRNRTSGGAHVSHGGEQILIVLVHIMGIPNHPCQWLQNKQLPVLFSCYKNGTCTLQQICLFVLSNICIIKGCICTVYKCYGHCHSHAQHTALASPERTQQSWCTLEATCVPKSWIFSVPLCSGSQFLIDHEAVCSKVQIQYAGTCFCADGIRFLVKCDFLFRRLLSHLIQCLLMIQTSKMEDLDVWI